MSLSHSIKTILFLCIFTPIAKGQENYSLWLNNLDKKKGLSTNNNITGVLQDSEGFVWIATFDAGLNRFDGINIKHFRANPNDSTSLLSDNLYGDLFEDKHKNIWFCASESIKCYNRKINQFKHYEIKNDALISNEGLVGFFFMEKDSLLWGKTRADNSLFRFNIYNPKDQKKIGNTIYDINLIPGVTADGRLKYIFSIDGLKSAGLELFELNQDGNLKSKTQHFYQQDSSLVLNIHSVIYKNVQEVLLSTTQGLFSWNVQTKSPPTLLTSSPLYHSIMLDSSRLLLRTENNGFKIYNQSNNTSYPVQTFLTEKPDAPTSNTIKKPFLFEDDIIWIEYLKSGLVYTSPTKAKFTYLPKEKFNQKTQNYVYRSFLEDCNSHIWYITYPLGLTQCDKNGIPIKFHKKKKANSLLSPNQVFDIYKDSNENIWVGSADGLAFYNYGTEKFEIILDNQNKSVPYLEKIYELSDGTLLAVSYLKGVFILAKESNKWVLNPIPSFEEMDGYLTIYEDKLNQVYLGFNDKKLEVYKWKNKALEKTQNLNINGRVNGFHEDEDGQTLWIATTTGLYAINKRKLEEDFTVFNQEDGLIDNSIQSMAVDRSGKFWLGTKNGLSLFNPIDTTFQYFTQSDGAVSYEFHEKSVLTRKDGSIWFGGNNGITIINAPEKIGFSKKPAKIQIIDYKINDESPLSSEDTCAITGASNITQIQHLKLPHFKNTLSFNFTAIDYADPTATQLKYILEPYDKNYVYLERGQAGFTRYSNLPSGNYTLKIKGSNSDGYWHPAATKELKITIIPRLIERKWFQLLLASIFGLFIWGIYKYRVKQIQEKASLKTRAAENKMAALRAQMNPHFAFNSLQSINGFIANDDKLGAIEYVSQFSDLMRLILENSRKNKIPLEKEIDLLRLYVQVEALRFSQPFEYEFIIDDNLDTFDTQVPAMILQPFVENSIKHGLFHKKSLGQLLISFKSEKNFLHCTIEDNGIGRKKSQQINTQKGRRHKSRGLEIVKERLAILQQSNAGKFYYTITDLFDKQQQPSGTRVEIKLPL